MPKTQKATTILQAEERAGLQWSAKGDAIVFGIGCVGAFFNGITTRSSEGGDRVDGGAQIAMDQARRYRPAPMTKGPNNNGFPSLAPDGTGVVDRTFGPDGDGLRITNLSTSAVTTLTTGYDNFPLWSPRGDSIMFSRALRGDYAGVHDSAPRCMSDA